MNAENAKKYWWPLATTSELPAKQLLARHFFGLPLVLFRDSNNSVSIFVDRCPHRFAPLSKGKLIKGELECPYHGWRFNAQGHCVQVPGLAMGCSAQPILQRLNAYEMHGLVWVNARSEPMPVLPDNRMPATVDVDSFLMTDTINAGLADVAENFLDGFHTHFVHRGWIRRNSNRQDISAKISSFANGIEVEYAGEKNQNGVISRLFEPERGVSISRFHLPGLAEIEYRDRRGRLSLLASLWMAPAETAKHLRVFIRISTAKGKLPALLKHFFLKRLFGVILQQDKNILELTHHNSCYFSQLDNEFAKTSPLNTANDLIGPSIRKLLNGEELEQAEEIRVVNL